MIRENIGEQLSFYQLFNKGNFKIEIPIIQRDYVQGNNANTDVRNRFVDVLLKYLSENKPYRDLDFIYGTTELTENNKQKFIPLDGQQRLTTLFLLHWYLANTSLSLKDFNGIMLADDKSNFTYYTRTSSSEFFDKLMSEGIDFKNLLKNESNQESLSVTIKDCSWFFNSWTLDPTIQSVLDMLDYLHTKFRNKPEFYERLKDIEDPVITFHYLDLNKYNLTEDLYIKMNSRGKPLTPFENFKAKTEQKIKALYEGCLPKYEIIVNDNAERVDTSGYFSWKIDTGWADIFWPYRNLVGNENTYDDELMHFILFIGASTVALRNKHNKNLFNTLNENLRNDGNPRHPSYYFLENEGLFDKDFIENLIASLDAIKSESNKIKSFLNEKYYYNEESYYHKIFSNTLSRKEKIKFYAYIKYLRVNGNKTEGLYQWLRVIHNLVQNTNIDNNENQIAGIKSVEKLISYSDNILKALKKGINENLSFFSTQIIEEEIKAFLITKSVVWKNRIESAEKCKHFDGQILFILEFCGISDYYVNYSHLKWNDAEDQKFLNSFDKYLHKSIAFFDFTFSEGNIDFLLERAVLTKGDYLIDAGNYRYSFLTSKKIANYLRDYSWKSLLEFPSVGNESEIFWKEKRSYVKQLFDDELFNIESIKKSLIEIIKKSTIDDWRERFIQNPELIRYCHQGLVRFVNDEDIMLVMNRIESSRMREMYTYNMFTMHLQNNTRYSPLTIWHQERNKEYESSFIRAKITNDYRIIFHLDIHKDYKQSEYIIHSTNNRMELEDKNGFLQLNKLFGNLNFNFDSESKSFSVVVTSDDDCLVILKSISQKFRELGYGNSN